MRFFRLFVILLTATSLSTLPAAATWSAVGDWMHVSAGQSTEIPVARLVQNDLAPPSGALAVRVLDGPSYLSAPAFGTPDRLVFDATDVDYGDFAIRYELRAPTGAAVEVDGVISVVPDLQPIAGNWSVILPGGGGGEDEVPAGCELGDGAELGLYNAGRESFSLCDFNGTQDLESCVHWQVPDAGQRPPGAVTRLAMVADWDGDGVDEPALYDPELGVLQTYDYASFCASGSCLVLSAEVTFGGAPDARPLAGLWRSPALEFASYDLVAGELTMPGGTILADAAPAPATWPVVAAWSGGSLDSLGSWHDTSSELHYLAPGGTATGLLRATERGTPVHGFAAAGRWSDCGKGADFLIVFDPSREVMTLVPTHLEDGPRGLHVKVVVDPGGGD